MKVKQLKVLLANLPDNADIMLWNGLVDDVMPIDSVNETRVIKPTLDFYRKCCLMDKGLSPNAIATDDQERKIKGSYNRLTYEHNRFVPDQWLKEGTHKSKRVFVIDAKLTGKSIHDRLGSISY